MISHSEKYRTIRERQQLMGDKIWPRILHIVGDVGSRVSMQVVLIERENGAIVAQVPVERRPVAMHALRDGRHHDVAAVARVSRHGKPPGWVAALVLCRLLRGQR